jgi:GT2 family glycosyltransferase
MMAAGSPATMSTPDGPVRLVVVMPVHNRRALTLGCLRSLATLDTAGLDLHVIVVDDGSTDGTAAAIADAHPGVEVIQGDGTLWFTEGTNVGVRRALVRDPDFVLMINDDQVFEAGCLRSLVETARAQPRSVLGPLLLRWDVPDRLFQTAPRWETWRGGWRHWYRQTPATVPAQPWLVDLIVGNCVLVPAAAFRECGLMDAVRFPNFGDAEFTPRLRRAGWQLIIDPRARVLCQPNTAPASVRTLPGGRRWRALLVDRRHPANLRRRFDGYCAGAPTPVHGVVAFAVFFLRWLAGRNVEAAYGADLPEPPLRDVYAARLVATPGDRCRTG